MRTGEEAGARSRGAGARRRARALLAGALLASACSLGTGRRHAEPPEPALRIWTPGLVHWSGGQRDLRIALENGTNRTIRVEAPDPRRARVVLYSDSGPARVCGHEPDAAEPTGEAISLAPGEARDVRVDLARACGRVPPGEYRYEAGYEAPPVGPGPAVRPRPTFGHVVVEAGAPSLDRGSLGSGDEGGGGEGRGGTRRTRR